MFEKLYLPSILTYLVKYATDRFVPKVPTEFGRSAKRALIPPYLYMKYTSRWPKFDVPEIIITNRQQLKLVGCLLMRRLIQFK